MSEDRPERPHDTDPAIAPAGASGGSGAAGRAPRAVRSGDVLGRYELAEELGEGGMATVFRARDRELRRDVAVKVLFPHLARRAEVVRRFHREARAAAGLEHPNILRIYDVGGNEPASEPSDARQEVDPPYIVMELIRGRTLLQEIEQRGPILAELAACIGALLADALSAAHAAGIVHRDIKPSNVLIAQGGRLLLADFGVARLETEDSLVTRTGALLGTPAYMSPEQATGETATARSDLYSLGATLYQLSTGLLPYSGSPAKVMSAIAAGQLVAPVKRRASVGPELSRAIEHMMESDAAARPASASQVAAELRRIAAEAGFGDATEELAAYFADPEGFVRARTPAVITALAAAARRAIDDERLPRALALADRASALAPDDPEVAALVEAVTEGGRSRRRRRAIALAAAGLVLGGAAAGAIALSRGDGGGQGDADPGLGSVAAIADAGSATDAAIDSSIAAGEAIDGALGAIDGAVAVVASPLDAAAVRAARPDAAIDAAVAIARAPRDAAELAVAPAAPLDAAEVAPPAPVPVDAAPAPAPALGTLRVKNDTWCNLTIGDTDHGRITQTKTVSLPAGRYAVVCEQPNTTLKWRREVEVIAAQTVSLEESMIPEVELVVETSGDHVTIDGAPAQRGATVRLKAGQHRVSVRRGDRELMAGWVTVPRTARCRLREVEAGKLVCDP